MTQLQNAQISSSTAENCTVKTPSDEKVGSIKDIMVDTRTGTVSYVVLKVNEGFLNLGSKLLALPWESFQFDTAQDDVVIVKESKETLADSPGFDEDNWPTGPQLEFISSMRDYYGQKDRSLYEMTGNRSEGISSDRVASHNKETNQIKPQTSGASFLEKKREDEKLTSKRGGNPII